jgi:hypothetical protein
MSDVIVVEWHRKYRWLRGKTNNLKSELSHLRAAADELEVEGQGYIPVAGVVSQLRKAVALSEEAVADADRILSGIEAILKNMIEADEATSRA